jgi:hypothetical protein
MSFHNNKIIGKKGGKEKRKDNFKKERKICIVRWGVLSAHIFGESQ